MQMPLAIATTSPLQLAATAEATMVCVSEDYRPRRIPDELLEAAVAGRPMSGSAGTAAGRAGGRRQGSAGG